MLVSLHTVNTVNTANRAHLVMFKKSAVEKRLRKISKQEALNVKLLEKQVSL